MHHHVGVRRKVSKVRKFLLSLKLSVLIDYRLIVIDYIVLFETMIDFFRSLCFNR